MGHPGEVDMSTGIDGTTRLNGARVGSKSDARWVGPAKLVIVTQHEFTAAGIEALLLAGGHHVLARCTCWDDLLLSLMSNRPDTLLLNLVTREAARLISQLRADHRSLSIILMLDERDAITAASLLELDVEGILLGAACASSLLQCVESVCHGRRWVDPDLLRHLALAERTAQVASRLTRREADIANLISRGLHNKQIARELHVAEGTVKMHLHHIYEKLHLHSRTELALSVTVRAEDDLVSGRRRYAATAKASS
jgi:two-component system, NarL family, nitrate/nitrite response regulator NarL